MQLFYVVPNICNAIGAGRCTNQTVQSIQKPFRVRGHGHAHYYTYVIDLNADISYGSNVISRKLC